MDHPNEEGEFEVKDRRRFSVETGEIKENSPPAQEARPKSVESQEEPSPPPVEMTFSGFILGLSTQALMYLGEVSDPQGGVVSKDLSAARQMIDVLGMLGEKTRGNLDPNEKALMDRVLYDLRTKYVELSKS